MQIKKAIKGYIKNTYLYIGYKMIQIKNSEIKNKEHTLKVLDFHRNFLKHGDLCFDIGANIGNKTAIYRKLGCNVIAVEPQTYCVKFLRFRFGSKVKLIHKGIAAKSGKGEIKISDSDTISSLSNEWIEKVSKERFKTYTWQRREKIELITLDQLINDFGKPQFCKIDVEGSELEVVKGLGEKIPLISIEFNFPESFELTMKTLNELNKLGNYVCNYTMGEEPQFLLNEWCAAENFMHIIKALNSNQLVWGDIYINYKD